MGDKKHRQRIEQALADLSDDIRNQTPQYATSTNKNAKKAFDGATHFYYKARRLYDDGTEPLETVDECMRAARNWLTEAALFTAGNGPHLAPMYPNG